MTTTPISAPCGHDPICSDQEEGREMALAHWQAHIHQLRLLVEHADEFTPSAFVRRVDQSLAELRKAAMGTVIHVLNRP